VRGFWPGAAPAALAEGDELLAVGDADLRGVGSFGAVARIYQQSAGELSVPVRFARNGHRSETTLELLPVPLAWRTTVVSFAFAVVGALALWRGRGSGPARLFFLSAVLYAFHWCYFWGGAPAQTYAAVLAFGLGMSLAPPFMLRIILTFPEEVARYSRAASLWPFLFVITGVALTSWAFGAPLAPEVGRPVGVAASVAFIVVATALLTQNFRRATPVGRRQIKWVVFGFYVGLAPALISGALAIAEPQLWWLYETSLVFVVLIPICLLVALVRYNLLDIDHLITAAASYTILSVILLASLLLAIPRASTAVAEFINPTVSQTILYILVAGVLLPTQRKLEGGIGAVLFPERRALREEAQRVRGELAECRDPSELLTTLGQRLDQLVRPERLVIYGRTGDAYAPVFERGQAVLPAFDATSPLLSHLAGGRGAVDATRLGRSRDGPVLSAKEQAALESMAIEVLVPLVLAGQLAAFVCLGEKRSGDVFTSTDLALLQSLADRASDLLQHFDELEVYRQEHAMYERLRRYVPGAVAERLRSGDELEAEAREVTVLFVDIQGYMSFTEGHRPEAIFSLVNRYTQTVSQIVRQCGGAVVEFNGDGMMAVFGAPLALAQKERAAVRAGRQIVAAIQALVVEDAAGQTSRLAVGVGIATGEAFVGSIQAVDRMIWSALGNTTNLAARLQTMTRQLGASIVIDAATRSAAASDVDDFQPHQRATIRGRRAPIDVFALPKAEAGSPEPGARRAQPLETFASA
jgi:class 3 adenylate cyclase